MKQFNNLIWFLCILTLYFEHGNGSTYLNHIWNIPRSGVEISVQSAGYPEQALGNTVQRWNIRTNPGNVIMLKCYEIRLTKMPDGSCTDYVFRFNDSYTSNDYCGGHYDLVKHSKGNTLMLSFTTGIYDSGYVNCSVQATQPISINYNPTTEPGQDSPAVDSVEIDSSEDGGVAGSKSTNCSCGWANKAMKRVIGGKETGINEFPFNVALRPKASNSPFCGGSIITAYHVLTCAHCVYKQSAMRISVTVGEHDWTKVNESNFTKSIDVIHMELHANYKGNEPNYDIAILVLAEKINFNKYVGPICLPNRQLNLIGDHVKVIGWGLTSSMANPSNYVKKVNVKVVPLTECAKSFPKHVNLSDPRLICTYSKMKGIGLGDSGGPVVWLDPETNRYTIVGLPALILQYSGQNHFAPDMSTDVSSHINWIARIVDLTVPTVKTCTGEL